jgi:hypothetical protein
LPAKRHSPEPCLTCSGVWHPRLQTQVANVLRCAPPTHVGAEVELPGVLPRRGLDGPSPRASGWRRVCPMPRHRGPQTGEGDKTFVAPFAGDAVLYIADNRVLR